MSAARFLLGLLTVALSVLSVFLFFFWLGGSADTGGWAQGTAVAALGCGAIWAWLDFVCVEVSAVVREVSTRDPKSYRLGTVVAVADDPVMAFRLPMLVLSAPPSVGDRIRLLVPIHRPAGASINANPERPALRGPALVLGDEVRLPFGRWNRLAGRPVWRGLSMERLLDFAAGAVSEVVLDWHRNRCFPVIAALDLTPEFLALKAAFTVSWPTIVRRALEDQGEIFDATAGSRALVVRSLRVLLVLSLLVAPAVFVVPDLVRILWAATSALFTGSPDPLADRVHWGAAVAASGLPRPDLYAILAGAVIVAVALIRALVRSARAYRRAHGEWRADLTVVIRRRLRDEYQRIANGQEAPTLDFRRAPGFSVLSADQVVPRNEAVRLRGLVFDLGASAVALSGARGVGKTTLLQGLAADQESGVLGMVVSAPVRYEPRGFLLHLYAQLCRTILDRLGDDRARSRVRWALSQARRLLAWILRTAATLCVLAVVFVGTREWLAGRLPVPRLPATYLVCAAALAVLAVWVRGRAPARELALAAEAAKRLRQTRYLQTVSAERSAGVGRGPWQVGLKRARQWAEQPRSLPELVDSYRTFATSVAAWWRAESGGRGKLVIAVDEADRIADPLLAEQFVNEIKATFGVPDCVVVVSMSDEALAGFERRLTRMRTVFDSAFDYVVRLRELSVGESVALLEHRVAGVPAAFWALCHCLAGGMPRDVLRMARTMLDEHRSLGGRTSLPDMAARLVALEVQAVKRAVQREAATEGDAALRALCADAAWPGDGSADIRRAARDQKTSASAAAGSIAAHFLFYARALDLFDRPRQADDPVVAELTAVHRLLSVNPSVAVEELERA